jgi:hypothetical protein
VGQWLWTATVSVWRRRSIVIDVTQYDWETVYDADGYIDLLNTFSGHFAMQDWQRERLFGEIRRRLARRSNGLLHRHWGGVLHIARALVV